MIERENGFHFKYYIVIFIVCLAMLSAEITVTRLLAYKFFFNFVFLVLSLAQLGIATAAAWIFAKARADFAPGFFRRSLLGMAVAPALFLGGYVWLLPAPNMGGKIHGFGAIPYLALLSLPLLMLYFSAGCVLSAAFTQYKSRFNQLYAVDLTGASLGCLAALGGMALFGPVRTFLASGALAAAMALLVPSIGGPVWRRVASGGVVVVVLALLTVCWFSAPILEENMYAHMYKREHPGRAPEYAWNHLARTDRVEPGFYVIDGDASTDFSQDESDVEYLVAPSSPRVAIIGVGAGPQLRMAFHHAPRSVLTIDINPTILGWDRGLDRDYNGGLFNRSEVTVLVDEGRHALRSQPRDFDLIVMHAIDTYTASSMGAYSLTENNLYTVEAFKDFYAKLSPDGIMSIRRWLFYPPRETLRLFTTTFRALEELGIEHPEQHLIVLSPTRFWQHARLKVWGYLLLSKRPFSQEQLTAVDAYVATHGWTYLHRPGQRLETPYSELVYSNDRDRFYREYPYFVEPCYDSNPFFFQLVRPSSIFLPQKGLTPGYLYDINTYTLFATLIMLIVLSGFLLTLPVSRYRRRAGLPAPAAAVTWYFACLGLGFMAVELASIQVMTLFLGHPIYALSVNLLGLLAFAGVGSVLSRRLPARGGPMICLVIAALTAAAGFGLLPLVHALISAPLGVRVAVTLAYLALIGTPMGVPMALGIRQIGAGNHPQVAWAWACNGAAAVIGTNVCIIIMSYYGMKPVFLIGSGCYALAMVLLAKMTRAAVPETAAALAVAPV
jgi:spermidine synthase